MVVKHIILLVEEPSMEAFLLGLLPRILPQQTTFEIRVFQGKNDLLDKLEARLRGYAAWLPIDWRLVVLVDQDDDSCRQLKRQLEDLALRAGLRTKSNAIGLTWQLVNRIAIEELEAWYFGDWVAVREAYPRVSANIPQQQKYRNPDAISGGTWETFERMMQRYGYYKGGLAKIEAARAIGSCIDPARSRSQSFIVLCSALV